MGEIFFSLLQSILPDSDAHLYRVDTDGGGCFPLERSGRLAKHHHTLLMLGLSGAIFLCKDSSHDRRGRGGGFAERGKRRKPARNGQRRYLIWPAVMFTS